ncbi:hypothetical protein TNCV_5008361 [Trichonephila clavipes]|nr:hypothetical protein TNCV_5008361 [Trichonephila clavipes]
MQLVLKYTCSKIIPGESCGYGSLIVMVSTSWLCPGALVPLKTRCVERLMHAKCIMARIPLIGVMRWFEEGCARSGVVLII